MAENKCPSCGGKFGMSRHYYGCKSFCRAHCLDDYLNRKHLPKPSTQMEMPLDEK